MNKKAVETGTIIWIIIGVLILFWLISNNIYVSYATHEMGKDYQCVDSKVTLTENTLPIEFRGSPQNECDVICQYPPNWRNYYKERRTPTCDKSDIPICECEASFWSYYITPLF